MKVIQRWEVTTWEWNKAYLSRAVSTYITKGNNKKMLNRSIPWFHESTSHLTLLHQTHSSSPQCFLPSHNTLPNSHIIIRELSQPLDLVKPCWGHLNHMLPSPDCASASQSHWMRYQRSSGCNSISFFLFFVLMEFQLRQLYFLQLDSIILENLISSSVSPISTPQPFQETKKQKQIREPQIANNFSCIRQDLIEFHKYCNGVFG